jgi:hypothetical protein
MFKEWKLENVPRKISAYTVNMETGPHVTNELVTPQA